MLPPRGAMETARVAGNHCHTIALHLTLDSPHLGLLSLHILGQQIQVVMNMRPFAKRGTLMMQLRANVRTLQRRHKPSVQESTAADSIGRQKSTNEGCSISLFHDCQLASLALRPCVSLERACAREVFASTGKVRELLGPEAQMLACSPHPLNAPSRLFLGRPIGVPQTARKCQKQAARAGVWGGS